MSKLDEIDHSCIGTAESEKHFLKDIFVNEQEYESILNTPPGSPRLLVGKKGTGKSAILQFLEQTSPQSAIQALYLKPDDVKGIAHVGDETDLSRLKIIYFEAIIEALAIKVGSSLGGLLNEAERKIFEKAISSGKSKRDLVRLTLLALAKFGTAVSDIKFENLIPDYTPTSSLDIISSLKKMYNQGSLFFLLLDDIDQIANIEDARHLNRIWAYILAARKFSEEFVNCKCIISIRTEIWIQISTSTSGQRDQVDHIRRLVTQLDPNDEQIKRIIEKRLNYCCRKLGIQAVDPYDVFFEGHSVHLPTSEAKRSWGDLLLKGGVERPRSSIQFLGLLAAESKPKGKDLILQEVVNICSLKHSENTITDISNENEGECKNIREIVKSFSKLEFLIDAEPVKKHLFSLMGAFGIIIRGRTMQQTSDADIFLIWNYLHEIGFLNPRIGDSRMPLGYRHYGYKEDPQFCKQSNWNQMQKYQYEVHPAFRSFILAIKQDERASIGQTTRQIFN
jgi:hypothetical protein